MDDTPTHENISLYHRQGSFLDIDANGTQVNKIVGDGYTVIDKNGSIFIGGRCILTVGNGVSILVQGNADIEVEGSSVINLKNRADISVANDLNLSVGGDMKTKVQGNYIVEAANLGFKTAGDINAIADGNTLITGSSSMQLQTDGNMRLDYARGDFGNVADKAIVEATGLPFIEAGDARPNQFGYLSTPVRPDPPVKRDFVLEEENEQNLAAYVANPDAFKNPVAAANGVKENYAGTPKDAGNAPSLKSDAASTDIQAFLTKQLELTKANGYWSETGMGGAPSNPNILRIWKDLGRSEFKSDQVAWCAGFQNWVLKQCGYRYVGDSLAKSIHNNPSKWNATKVSYAEVQPGDIAVWSFSHVAFVYNVVNGKIAFVGGNQSARAKAGDNNPSKGDCTICWANTAVGDPNNPLSHPPLWTPASQNEKNGSILGFYRPSKT
jgi:hypothetical protein